MLLLYKPSIPPTDQAAFVRAAFDACEQRAAALAGEESAAGEDYPGCRVRFLAEPLALLAAKGVASRTALVVDVGEEGARVVSLFCFFKTEGTGRTHDDDDDDDGGARIGSRRPTPVNQTLSQKYNTQVPIYENMVLGARIRTSPLGGRDLTAYLASMLESCTTDPYSAQPLRRRLGIARAVKERHAYVVEDFAGEVCVG